MAAHLVTASASDSNAFIIIIIIIMLYFRAGLWCRFLASISSMCVIGIALLVHVFATFAVCRLQLVTIKMLRARGSILFILDAVRLKVPPSKQTAW